MHLKVVPFFCQIIDHISSQHKVENEVIQDFVYRWPRMKSYGQNKSNDKSACKRGSSVFHVAFANSEVFGEHDSVRPPLLGSPSSH